ncbi:MAG: hypothetical protein PVI43_00305 [Candidatus Bathyarchaeota archaeon]
MSRVIGVRESDGVIWHAINCFPTDYDTLCGLDANDPYIHVGTFGTVKAPPGQKITCPQCISVFTGFREAGFRKSDFEI